MIQRIQSVFLLLLALSMLSMLALPLWHKADALTHQELTLGAFGYSAQGMAPPGGPVWIIGLLALASAGVAAYEIFQFKNRLLQLKLGALNMLLLVATFGVAFYFAGRGEVNLNIRLLYTDSFLFALWFHFQHGNLVCGFVVEESEDVALSQA
ncbi:MAG: DUF4293 family protein [Hymenobacter sp.]|nr:MAG: DUF4293 family protein [Hymenobacter sp.]